MKALVVPPALSRVVPSISALCAETKHHIVTSVTPSHVELEARLGVRNVSGFKPGVCASWMSRTVRTLRGFKGWQPPPNEHWTQTKDFAYSMPNGSRIRTSVCLNDSQLGVTHVEKTCIQKLDVIVKGTTGNVYDIRVSMNHERHVPQDEVPAVAAPERLCAPDGVAQLHSVRIKHRISFTHGAWRFDVTKVWTSATNTEAEAKCASEEPNYEFELEFVGGAEYFAHEDHTPEYMAVSLLLRLFDLFEDGACAALN